MMGRPALRGLSVLSPLLAQAYRETGTMEGRARAIALLDQVRRRHYDTFRYHREFALVYLDGGRYDDAREAMLRAVKRAPNAIFARGELAEMLFRHALRTCEQDDVTALVRFLDETLVIAPRQRDALLYKSLALDLGSTLDPARRTDNALGARTCAEFILQEDPSDRLALLLQGAHCLDLGNPDRAAVWFQRGIEASPTEDRAAFLTPTLCAPDAVLRQLAAAPAGRTDSLTIGLPAGDGRQDPWAGARVDLRVLDATGREMSAEVQTVAAGGARPLPAGVALYVIGRDTPLPPGRYTAEVRIATDTRSGAFNRPLLVRSFGRDSLQLSDLRLGFAGEPADTGSVRAMESAADPTGLAPRGVPLEVRFEVYNLVPTSAGLARYRVRYTVLPLAYAREYSRMLAAGNAAHDPALQFGGLGRSLGGVVLEEANYADLLFPPMETRLAPAARCRAAFRLETASLRDGSYALLVTVTDLNADRTVAARAPFAILSPEAFRTALGAE